MPPIEERFSDLAADKLLVVQQLTQKAARIAAEAALGGTEAFQQIALIKSQISSHLVIAAEEAEDILREEIATFILKAALAGAV